MYTIEEQFIQSKTPSLEFCEDGIFITSDFIAIIDGLTGNGALNWDGKTGGARAREILWETMKDLPREVCAKEAVIFLNEALAKAGEARSWKEEIERGDRLMAAVIIYSDHLKQIWSFGDCQCLINGQLYSHDHKIDSMLAEVRSLRNRAHLEEGSTLEEVQEYDPGMAYILPLLKNQPMYANTADFYGYDILDGYKIYPERVVVHQLAAGDRVVMASNGYPVLKETLKESEEELERLIREDPLCIFENKCTRGISSGNNRYDNRAYLSFSVIG